MSWSENALPWLSAHAISIIVVICLLVLAEVIYSRTFRRRTHKIGFTRRIDQLVRQRSQPPQSESEDQ